MSLLLLWPSIVYGRKKECVLVCIIYVYSPFISSYIHQALVYVVETMCIYGRKGGNDRNVCILSSIITSERRRKERPVTRKWLVCENEKEEERRKEEYEALLREESNEKCVKSDDKIWIYLIIISWKAVFENHHQKEKWKAWKYENKINKISRRYQWQTEEKRKSDKAAAAAASCMKKWRMYEIIWKKKRKRIMTKYRGDGDGIAVSWRKLWRHRKRKMAGEHRKGVKKRRKATSIINNGRRHDGEAKAACGMKMKKKKLASALIEKYVSGTHALEKDRQPHNMKMKYVENNIHRVGEKYNNIMVWRHVARINRRKSSFST